MVSPAEHAPVGENEATAHGYRGRVVVGKYRAISYPQR